MNAPVEEQLLRMSIAIEAKSWVGTKFFPHMAKKGVGADCVNLALAIYKAVGVIPESEQLPGYSLDGGDHLYVSLVESWLENSKWFAREDSPDCGSLITLQIGKVSHHVGIMVTKSRFVQSIRNHGTVELDLRDTTWSKMFRTSWKPLCLEVQKT